MIQSLFLGSKRDFAAGVSAWPSFLKHNMTFMICTNLELLTAAPGTQTLNINQEGKLKDSEYLKRLAPCFKGRFVGSISTRCGVLCKSDKMYLLFILCFSADLPFFIISVYLFQQNKCAQNLNDGRHPSQDVRLWLSLWANQHFRAAQCLFKTLHFQLV